MGKMYFFKIIKIFYLRPDGGNKRGDLFQIGDRSLDPEKIRTCEQEHKHHKGPITIITNNYT